MTYKIMLIEDDPDIARLLSLHFQKFGFIVYQCIDFSKVVEEFEAIKPHLVILDINLPAYDGFYWCSKLRAKSPCPIIFLSSRNADADQVYAMMNGGDDYVTKPFSFDVITAKITAILRRTYGQYATTHVNDIRCGDCTFYPNKLVLFCKGYEVELSKTEASVIRMMFEKYPDIISREELLNEIWDDENFVEENTLNVNISRLRKKLENIHSCLTIKPIRGIGYRIGEIRYEK